MSSSFEVALLIVEKDRLVPKEINAIKASYMGNTLRVVTENGRTLSFKKPLQVIIRSKYEKGS